MLTSFGRDHAERQADELASTRRGGAGRLCGLRPGAGCRAGRLQGASAAIGAGLATSAAMNGVGERKIMQQTRHTSERMLRKYIREGDLFNGNAAGLVGL